MLTNIITLPTYAMQKEQVKIEESNKNNINVKVEEDTILFKRSNGKNRIEGYLNGELKTIIDIDKKYILLMEKK